MGKVTSKGTYGDGADRSSHAQVHEPMRQIGREIVKVARRRRRTRGACVEV